MTRTEAIAAKWLEGRGLAVQKNGWPDFLCISSTGLIAVEVKSRREALTPAQKVVSDTLREHGVAVGVLRVRSDGICEWDIEPQVALQARADVLEKITTQLAALAIQLESIAAAPIQSSARRPCVTFRQLSRESGVSVDTLRRLAASGLLHTIHIGSRHLVTADEAERITREGTGKRSKRQDATAALSTAVSILGARGGR